MIMSEDHFPDNPFELFSDWYEQGVASGTRDPDAMTLATADPGGKPSARIVLMKEISREGVVFYLNPAFLNSGRNRICACTTGYSISLKKMDGSAKGWRPDLYHFLLFQASDTLFQGFYC